MSEAWALLRAWEDGVAYACDELESWIERMIEFRPPADDRSSD